MKDAFGNTVKIGDEVIYIDKLFNSSQCGTQLSKGIITNIYKNSSNKYECSVDKKPHIQYYKIAKISSF